jgi:hypothetical protein
MTLIGKTEIFEGNQINYKSGPTLPGLDRTQVLLLIWITFRLYIAMFVVLNLVVLGLALALTGNEIWLVEWSFFSFHFSTTISEFKILPDADSYVWPSTLLNSLFWQRFILHNRASIFGIVATLRDGPPKSCDYTRIARMAKGRSWPLTYT